MTGKDATLKDFLFEIQQDKDKGKEGLLAGKGSERKNILNLKIVCCVDISGSISEEQYNSFMSQLRKIKGISQVMVIETDTDICAMYNFDKTRPAQAARLGGGGGTNFVTAFTKAQEMNPDAIVFLTDGDDTGDCEKPKDTPVAWVVTEHGHAPYEWGMEVGRIDK
jgi:predicted metal-dependent peptidase